VFVVFVIVVVSATLTTILIKTTTQVATLTQTTTQTIIPTFINSTSSPVYDGDTTLSPVSISGYTFCASVYPFLAFPYWWIGQFDDRECVRGMKLCLGAPLRWRQGK